MTTSHSPPSSQPGHLESLMNNSTSCPWVDVVELGRQTGKSSPVVSYSILVISIITLLANFLLAWIILSNKQLWKQRCNRYLVSIGICDSAMVTNLLIFVQPGLNDEGRYISAIKDDPAFCLAFTVVSQYLISASYYLFLGLMVDRLYALKRPLHYTTSMSHHGISKAISLCWLLALLPTVPLWVDTTMVDDMARGCTCYYPLNNNFWLLWTAVVGFFIPAAVIVFIWIVIAHHLATNPTDRVLKWCTIKIVLITALFLFTISPFSLVFTSTAMSLPTTTRLLDLTLPVSMLNSMIQPVLYISIARPVREAARELLGLKMSVREERLSLARQGSLVNSSASQKESK